MSCVMRTRRRRPPLSWRTTHDGRARIVKSQGLHLHALGSALLGYMLWVLSDTCMKLAGETDLPAYEIVGFLGGVGCLFLIIYTGARGKLRSLWPKSPRIQLRRGALSLICNVCNVIALKHLPLAEFFITVFTAPMMIALLAHYFLKEKLSKATLCAIIAGFAGVFLAINPASATHHGDWIGYIAASIGTLAFAMATVGLRITSQTETIYSLGFFSSFCNALFGFALMLHHGVTVSPVIFLILVAMGLFCIMGNLANYWALRHTAAGNVAALHYSQIVTGAIIGYIIWHDVPTLTMFIGAAVIIATGIYVAAHVHKAQAQAEVQAL